MRKFPVPTQRVWLILAVMLTTPAIGGEARRCLKDGKVVITDVSCELLGNAQDLTPPIPKNYLKREAPTPPQASPNPPSSATILPAPVASPQPSVDTMIWQMVEQLFKPLFLPAVLIFGLAAWLTRKTKQSWQRKLGNVLIDVARDQLARRREEPASPNTSAGRPQRQEPSWTSTSDTAAIEKPSAWSLSLIRDLEWKRYEDVCQQYYELKGIRSETTPLGPDGGIDIRLYQDDSEKPTAIVQCKSWNERYVGVSLIRELLGVMTHEKIDKGFFMATSSFSDDAKSFAAANRITLVDGPILLLMIRRLPIADRDKLLAFATEGDYQTPTCPSCGVKMVAVSGSLGKPDFWGCPRYPKCRQRLGKRRD